MLHLILNTLTSVYEDKILRSFYLMSFTNCLQLYDAEA